MRLQTGAERKRGPVRTRTEPDQPHADPQARWQSIEVRHLAALAAVASEGSFRRAAERLGYVQSAISGQISHLEEAAGVRLLERGSGTPLVEVTPAGQVLLRHTEEILARFEAAYADVSWLPTRTAGVVKVAGLEELAPHQIAEILSVFRRRHPFARLHMTEAPRTTALTQLRKGELDLLVYEPPAVQDSIPQVALTHDDYVLVVPTGSGLAPRSTPISVNELVALRPIVPGSCVASETLVAQLNRLGVKPHGQLAPDSVATARALVANGMGTALAPARLVARSTGATKTIDLSHLLTPHTIVLASSGESPQSAAVEGLAQVIQEICAEPVDAAVRQDSAAA